MKLTNSKYNNTMICENKNISINSKEKVQIQNEKAASIAKINKLIH